MYKVERKSSLHRVIDSRHKTKREVWAKKLSPALPLLKRCYLWLQTLFISLAAGLACTRLERLELGAKLSQQARASCLGKVV